VTYNEDSVADPSLSLKNSEELGLGLGLGEEKILDLGIKDQKRQDLIKDMDIDNNEIVSEEYGKENESKREREKERESTMNDYSITAIITEFLWKVYIGFLI
jgi:hypothetical protein